MKYYDYILFDLDGTLTDSKPGIIECIAYALEKENVPYTNQILDKMVGPPFRVSMHDFLGLEMPEIEKLIGIQPFLFFYEFAFEKSHHRISAAEGKQTYFKENKK